LPLGRLLRDEEGGSVPGVTVSNFLILLVSQEFPEEKVTTAGGRSLLEFLATVSPGLKTEAFNGFFLKVTLTSLGGRLVTVGSGGEAVAEPGNSASSEGRILFASFSSDSRCLVSAVGNPGGT
jgi:hypothetical protein